MKSKTRMSFEEENFGFLHKRLVHGKDKCEIFLKQREFHLEVKLHKVKQVESTEAKPKEVSPEYNVITNDIWYHVSKHIPPQFVQTFALINKQTAALVRTKSFWKHLYLKYCQKFDQRVWVLKLPAHLQLDNIRHFSPSIFRTCVIEALFYSYEPLMQRLNSYNLDLLLGRTYISAWHKLWDDCKWFICYQFKQKGLQRTRNKTNAQKKLIKERNLNSDVVNDWESLASSENEDNIESDDDEDDVADVIESPYEGVCLLLIFGPRFIPFPMELTYNANTFCNRIRLGAIRRLLTSDMREYNLELDFINTVNKDITTIKYPTAKHLVIPWWHPEFKKCIKFEDNDKFS